MNLLECKNVSFGYDGRTVLEDVNFAVEDGEYLCIVGENGSGKSTLMKGLLGLKKPSGGQILFAHGFSQKQIGYLPQQTEVQRDFPASVQEVVQSGCLNASGWHPFFTKAQKNRAVQNMERFSILDLKDRCYKELSGGQQQRVLLARALCATDKLLLLDEPAAGLDPVVTAQLYEVIADVNRHDGVTVIMVSHDIAGAVRYADKILHIGSKQLFFGTVEAYRVCPLYARFEATDSFGRA